MTPTHAAPQNAAEKRTPVARAVAEADLSEEGLQGMPAFADSRVGAVAQCRTAEAIHSSPRMLAQRGHLIALNQHAAHGSEAAAPVQRTVYKIASEGPEFHETDPERYANLVGDEHVHKSLHRYQPDEIDLSVATSPITIFMHGGTMAKWTATRLFEFLEARHYKPKPDSDIVFITCRGATLMDAYLLSKGQALANLLGARVHLAHGIVKINSQGVPYVERPGTSTPFDYVNSKAELAQILKGRSDGWQTYVPDAVTYEMLKDAIRRGRWQLREFSVLPFCKDDVDWYRDVYLEFEEELKEDRRYVLDRYETARGIQQQMEKHLPRLDLFNKLQRTAVELTRLAETTELHKQRALALAAEYQGWSTSVSNGGDVGGFEALFNDKQSEWIAPLRASIQAEIDETHVQPGSGWEDIELDFDQLEAASTTSDALQTAEKPPDTNGEDGSKQLKKLPTVAHGAMPVQRQIIADDTPLANGKTLAQVLSGMPDIDLVRGHGGIDLTIRFVSMAGKYGVTRLKVGDDAVVAEEHIKPENARQHYTIEIELNREYYHSGQRPESMGSLIETLTHEWTLHGAQHAVNINSVRYGLEPDVKIDHESMFSDKMNHMDFAIALQIHREKRTRLGAQIYKAYLNDVVAHKDIVKNGWDGEHRYKGSALCAEFRTLHRIDGMIGNGEAVNPVLKESLKRLQAYNEWLFEDYGYQSLASMDDLDTKEVLQCLDKISVVDLQRQPLATQLLAEPIRKLRPLVVELADVKRIQAVGDPTTARKAALKTLSVDTDTLDQGIGVISGVDEGVDFEASSKKMD